MKLLLSLLLPALSHSLTCPDPLEHEFNITDELTMYFDLVLSEPNITDGSIFCARFESLTTGWIGFGISPTKDMVGAEAVIGIPSNNTVKKYILFAKNVLGVVEMDEEDQTLIDTSITQDEEGRTTMTFTKYLFEDKYGIMPSDFINSFIWAVGSSNDLSYHGSNRGNFGMDFLTTLPPSPTVVPATAAPSSTVTTSTTEGTGASASPSVVAGENGGDGSASPALTANGDAFVDNSWSPTLIVTSQFNVSSSPTLTVNGGAPVDGSSFPTLSVTVDAPINGSPSPTLSFTGNAPIDGSSSPTLAGTLSEPVQSTVASIAEDQTTGSFVAPTEEPNESEDDVATPSPVVSENVTEDGSANELDFVQQDNSASGAEKVISSARSFYVGGLNVASGIVLSFVLKLYG